jgi:hypothetical protein
MNCKRPFTLPKLLSVLCLIAVLAGCAPQPAAFTPTIPSLPTAITAPTSIEYLARNEIVITGLENDVNDIVSKDTKKSVSNTAASDYQILGKLMMQASFNSSSANLNPRNENPPSLSPHTKVPTTSLFPSQGSKVVMRVYEHLGDYSTLVNDIQSINGLGLNAFAEPNWYISSSASESKSCALPHSGGGSPIGAVIKNDANINNDAFNSQWAFTKIGFPPTPAQVDPLAEKPAVIILDTVPKQYQGTERLQDAPLNGPNHYRIFIEDSLYIRSKKNPNIPTPTPLPSHAEETNHGWLEAGIIKDILHRGGLDADVYLFRVLDDYGCGDIGLIGTKIIEAVNMLDNGKRSIVINASFGTYYDPRISIFPNADQPNGIALFQQILSELHLHHAIMVAAAGNNSSLDNVKPMNIPAIYDSVIGVASSTQQNGRSCFSNQGDIAAPGGDGVGQNCEPAHKPGRPDPCPTVTMAECPYTIIGPAKGSTSGFGAWAGTSFATPIIVATLISALVNPNVQGDQSLAVCMLEQGAMHPLADVNRDLGFGIVNIEQTLAEETINKCKSSRPQ